MRKLLIAALACLCTAGLAAVSGGTAHAAAAGCTGTLQLSVPTFDQPSAGYKQTVTASATIQNCTDQPQHVYGSWLARSVMAPGVPYSFCAPNDPFPINAQIPAHGSTTISYWWAIYNPQCAAIAIHVTATLSTTPPITQGADIPVSGSVSPGSCTASYSTVNEAASGFVAQVTVTNASSGVVKGWSVSFTFGGDQRVEASWNAVVQQNGNLISATNAAWNGSIAPGSSVGFGLYGEYGRSDAPPLSLTCQAS